MQILRVAVEGDQDRSRQWAAQWLGTCATGGGWRAERPKRARDAASPAAHSKDAAALARRVERRRGSKPVAVPIRPEAPARTTAEARRKKGPGKKGG